MTILVEDKQCIGLLLTLVVLLLSQLKLLNPQLHEHYKTRIEAMDFTSQTAHEKLAILEISDSLALCRAGELRSESSLDKNKNKN